jgi:hypothetical protein
MAPPKLQACVALSPVRRLIRNPLVIKPAMYREPCKVERERSRV